MKNTGYVVHLTTKLGRTTSYVKDDDGWTQVRPTGLVRTGITAEQLLSRTYCRHWQATSRVSASEWNVGD